MIAQIEKNIEICLLHSMSPTQPHPFDPLTPQEISLVSHSKYFAFSRTNAKHPRPYVT